MSRLLYRKDEYEEMPQSYSFHRKVYVSSTIFSQRKLVEILSPARIGAGWRGRGTAITR